MQWAITFQTGKKSYIVKDRPRHQMTSDERFPVDLVTYRNSKRSSPELQQSLHANSVETRLVGLTTYLDGRISVDLPMLKKEK